MAQPLSVLVATGLCTPPADFTGREDVTVGLALRFFPNDAALPAAQAYARWLADNKTPLSTTLIKRLVYEYLGKTDRARATADQTDLTCWTGPRPNIIEAMTARAEKRQPQWKTSKLDVPDSAPHAT
jgi:enoyl-CoA hydratase/carnithine racemase